MEPVANGTCCKGPGYATPMVSAQQAAGVALATLRTGERQQPPCVCATEERRGNLVVRPYSMCMDGASALYTQDAFKNGAREKLVYLPCIVPDQQSRPDYLATVDVNPQSSTYSQVTQAKPVVRVVVRQGVSPVKPFSCRRWSIGCLCHSLVMSSIIQAGMRAAAATMTPPRSASSSYCQGSSQDAYMVSATW